ncbi:MAG: dihydrofolate reductase family protein [Ardenticatenaceae bacterium]|nr:dihydrofolate reductase family protein [Ardenticatenaceae bacterium]
MSNQPVLQLYPLPPQERPLTNLYLNHNLRQYPATAGRAFVYANFIASLDGRIAIPHPTKPGLTVPQQIANERDWRLFQELAAQADVIISSGRYLRDWADGRAQEILEVDDPRFADLRQWRRQQGLPPQPDIAIISRSLDFPIPPLLTAVGRRVIIFTTTNPNPQRVREIESQAGQVIVAGATSVAGNQMVQHLTQLGYQTIYSAAGPQILHLLLTGRVLDRLYLTHAHRLLGGHPYASIVEGTLLETAVNLTPHTIYHDPHGLDGSGQLFTAYNVPWEIGD